MVTILLGTNILQNCSLFSWAWRTSAKEINQPCTPGFTQFAFFLSHECFVQWFKSLVMFHWEDTYHRFLVHISSAQLLIHLQMSMSDGYSMLETATCFHPWFINHIHCEIKVNRGKNCKAQSSHSSIQGNVVPSFTSDDGSAISNSVPGAHGFEQGLICSAHSLIWPPSKTGRTRSWLLVSVKIYCYVSKQMGRTLLTLQSFSFNGQVEFSCRWRAHK